MARTTLRGKCGNLKWRWVGGVFLEKGQRDTIRITIDYGTEVGRGPIIVSKVCRRNEKYTRKNKQSHKQDKDIGHYPDLTKTLQDTTNL